jgi:hypothetical protein
LETTQLRSERRSGIETGMLDYGDYNKNDKQLIKSDIFETFLFNVD